MSKNYIRGSFRERETSVGKLLNVSLRVEDLAAIANEKGYADITISERKEVDEYGNTHYAYENDYAKRQATKTGTADKAKVSPPDYKEPKAKDAGVDKLPWEN